VSSTDALGSERGWIAARFALSVFGGLFFWLLVGYISTSSAIGYATTAFSVAALSSGLMNMGLGVSTLKMVACDPKGSFSTLIILAVPVGIFASALTLAFYSIYDSFLLYVAIAAVMALLSPMSLVTQNSILVMKKVRLSFFISALGVALRYALAVILVLRGLGGLGITVSLIASSIVVTLAFTAYVMWKIGIQRPTYSSARTCLRVGIVNYPGTLNAITMSTAVVVLGLVTADPSKVGAFYIAVMAALTVSTAASSAALALIPLRPERDVSTYEAMRIALAVAVLAALPLAAFPRELLSYLGPTFASGGTALTVLALAGVPFAALSILVSRIGADKVRVVMAGIIQLLILVVLMLAAAPNLEERGAALAYLLAASASALVLSERRDVINLGKAALVFALPWLLSYLLAASQALPWPATLLSIELLAALLLRLTGFLRPGDARLVRELMRKHPVGQQQQ